MTINKTKYLFLIAVAVLCFQIFSCNKYLDKKPAANLAVPSTLDNLQSMLDFQAIMNLFASGVGEASADNYYLPDATYNALAIGYQNTYTWNEDIYAGLISGDNPWGLIYNPVYYANVVLESLQAIKPAPSELEKWKQLKGAALFYRARSFHIAVVGWAQAYNPSTAATEPGVPLRLSSDFNQKSTRSSVAEDYQQIVADLEESVRNLPALPVHVMRPSRSSAYALLSRVWLAMQDYTKSRLYADSSLQLVDNLMDYNKLNASATAPIPAFNSEVLFHTSGPVPSISPAFALIDSVLFKQYVDSDLRKTIFFKVNSNGTVTYKGSYFGSSSNFTGLATDEVYLNKSECLIRQGKITEGLTVLDSLLAKRFKQGTFVPLQAASVNEAMQLVLTERRKELLMRDVRFMDLKRLNLEPQWQQTIRRVVAGKEITLPPNDKRYALQFPFATLDISGIPPNPR